MKFLDRLRRRTQANSRGKKKLVVVVQGDNSSIDSLSRLGELENIDSSAFEHANSCRVKKNNDASRTSFDNTIRGMQDEFSASHDGSVYTNMDQTFQGGTAADSTVYSLATTVQLRTAARKPLDDIGDIKPKIDMHRRNLRRWRSNSTRNGFGKTKSGAGLCTPVDEEQPCPSSPGIPALRSSPPPSPIANTKRKLTAETSTSSSSNRSAKMDRTPVASGSSGIHTSCNQLVPDLPLQTKTEETNVVRLAPHVLRWNGSDLSEQSFKNKQAEAKRLAEETKRLNDENSIESLSYAREIASKHEDPAPCADYDSDEEDPISFISAQGRLELLQQRGSYNSVEEGPIRSKGVKEWYEQALPLQETDDDSVGADGAMNVTDDMLMERGSPGTLRLTAEGLLKHDLKASEKALPNLPFNDDFLVWKLQMKNRRHPRRTIVEPEDEPLAATRGIETIADQNGLAQISEEHEAFHPPNKLPAVLIRPKKMVQALASSLRMEQDKDLENLSLAPLQQMRPCLPGDEAPVKPRGVGRRLLGVGRSGEVASETARAILEKERREAKEAREQKAIMERVEKERIERRRRAYLELQRAREASAARTPERRPILMSLEVVKRATEGGNALNSVPTAQESTTLEMSTLSSGSAFVPLCVVCNAAERTHIASPCMHFSFCAECATTLQNRENYDRCPVCARDGVSFAPVSV